MGGIATYRTSYTGLIALTFKVSPAIFFAGEMDAKTKNIHRLFSIKITFF
jgi:hypothetical protein